MNSITTLDDLWMGRPRSIAVGLLESDGHHTMVDPGPGSPLDTLHQRLRARGLGVGDLDAMLFPPIPLDHPAPTGPLVRRTPALAGVCHKNGPPAGFARSRLLAG